MKREALHPRHPELAALAQGARNSAREVAVFAAKTALQRNPVTDAPVPAVLEALERADIGTAVRLRPRLEALVEVLDGLYWDASDAAPSSDAPEVRAAFYRARAVNSLVCALTVNPVQAALDAVYEAHASLPEDEADEFVEMAKARLRKLQVEA